MGPYKLSKAGEARLLLVHPDLQKCTRRTLEIMDIMVDESTIRTIVQQKEFFDKGVSKTMDSLHLPRAFPEFGGQLLVCAVDINPYPLDFKNKARYIYMAGLFMMAADELYKKGEISHGIRWGGDWNRNNDPSDEKFEDMGHFELILD